jgi:hypothetical protein
MKARIATAGLALAVTLWSLPASADESGNMAVDTVIVRPVCFLATVLGSALFVVSLPIAAVSKSIKPAAHALVVRPANATFRRPLGDFSEFESSSYDD